MKPTESPLMRKLRLLQAKAEGTNNEHEAAAFAAKVQELLLEHGLTMRDVEATRPDDRAKVGPGDAMNMREFGSPARRLLLKEVCRLYMCDFIMWKKLGKLAIVGKPHNAEVAVEMTRYLIQTTIRLSNEHARRTGGNRIDFRRGCMLRLANRVNDLARERQQQANSSNPGNLPVLYRAELALVDEYMNTVRRAKTKPLKLGRDAREGYRQADGIGLDPKVRAAPEKRRLT